MAKDTEDYTKQLELALTQLDRTFGKGTVMRLGDDDIQHWPSISTGAFSLDLALGIGGFPLGRIVEVYGPEASGKSTLALSAVAAAQEMGGTCLYVDAEHALDPVYARNLGVSMDDLLLAQPDTGEQALDILETVVRSGALKVAVVDSVAALIPKAELEGDMSDNHMGLQPRMMSRAMRKLPGITANAGTLIIFVNQLRSKVGVVFGNPEITPGGNAMKYAASQRIDLRVREAIKAKDGSIIGSKIKAKIVKNKMAPPLKVTYFDILYGRGVNHIGCIVDVAIEQGVFTTKGGGYTYYQGDMLAQGRDAVIEYLASDLEFTEKIKQEIVNQ